MAMVDDMVYWRLWIGVFRVTEKDLEEKTRENCSNIFVARGFK
jgi:hypothetical protein